MTTENILVKNLQYIARYNKELERKISGMQQIDGDFEFRESKSNDAILYKDGKPTDDPIDPVWKSLEELKGLKYKIRKSLTLVLGLGLGYRLKEFATRAEGKVIIFEPDINLLRITLEVADLSEFLQKENVFIVSNYTELENLYKNVFFIHSRLNFLCAEYYLMNHSDICRQIKKKAEDLHSIYQSNYQNLFQKNSEWTETIFKNISGIVKNPDLDVLKDKFKGKTAVIIAAGPSLDKNIENLKPYRDKIVLFCVGTALKNILGHGIIPDFAVAVENYSSTYINLNVPEISDINLILSTRVYTDIYKLKARRIYNYHGQNTPAAKWLGQTLEKNLDLYNEAGTVSLTAFYSAKLMGFDKFIFIGQDLAYTDNRCYSKNTVFGNYKLDRFGSVKTDNMEESVKNLSVIEEKIEDHARFLGRDLFYIKGCREDKVKTTASLFLFIKYFEQIAEKFGSEVKLINATEGGAYLEGFEHPSLKEALEIYTSEIIETEEILNRLKTKSKDISCRKRTALEAMNEIRRNHNKIREIISDVYENEIMPRFNLKKNLEEYRIICKKYDIKSIILKKRQGSKPLANEEQEILSEYVSINQERLKLLKEGINYNFYYNFENFSQNLKIINEFYKKIETIINKNPYLYNFYFSQLLTINSVLKDHHWKEGCLKCLAHMINRFFMNFYFTEHYKTINNAINELESEREYAGA